MKISHPGQYIPRLLLHQLWNSGWNEKEISESTKWDWSDHEWTFYHWATSNSLQTEGEDRSRGIYNTILNWLLMCLFIIKLNTFLCVVSVCIFVRFWQIYSNFPPLFSTHVFPTYYTITLLFRWGFKVQAIFTFIEPRTKTNNRQHDNRCSFLICIKIWRMSSLHVHNSRKGQTNWSFFYFY